MKGKRMIALLLCVVCVFALAACSSNEDKIVGRWELEDGTWIEFFSDGTAVGQTGNRITYAVDGDRLRIDSPLGGSGTVTIDISGDTMTWSDPDTGNEIEFTRVK